MRDTEKYNISNDLKINIMKKKYFLVDKKSINT